VELEDRIGHGGSFNHEWTRIHTNDQTVELGLLFASLGFPFVVKIDRRIQSEEWSRGFKFLPVGRGGRRGRGRARPLRERGCWRRISRERTRSAVRTGSRRAVS